METNYSEMISSAQKGIRLMRSARPGCADMETRKALKSEACVLLDQFASIKRWPAQYRQAVREIEDSILNGYAL